MLNNKKKLELMLAAVMLTSVVPYQAFADEATPAPPESPVESNVGAADKEEVNQAATAAKEEIRAAATAQKETYKDSKESVKEEKDAADSKINQEVTKGESTIDVLAKADSGTTEATKDAITKAKDKVISAIQAIVPEKSVKTKAKADVEGLDWAKSADPAKKGEFLKAIEDATDTQGVEAAVTAAKKAANPEEKPADEKEMTLAHSDIALKVGETKTVAPDITPQEASNAKITLNVKKGAPTDKVKIEGNKVIGLKEGSTTITITATKDGFKEATKDVNVTVSKAEVPVSISITDVKVYYNQVTGKTSPYATVALQNGSNTIRTTTADSRGNFTINYQFGRDYYGYYDYYRYYGNYVRSFSNERGISGYTNAYAYVEARDRDGVRLDSTRADSRGYYSLSWSGLRSGDVYITDRYYNDYKISDRYYYDDYYYRDNRYYYTFPESVVGYKLVATAVDGKTYTRDLLNSDKVGSYYNRPYYYYNGDYSKAAVVSQAKSGEKVVKGYGVDSYASITVKDNLGYTLGSATANSKGEFTVYLNRELKSGEKITVESYANRYARTSSVTVTVDGKTATSKSKYDTTLTIGSKTLKVVKDGVSSTKTMDVAPYIKEGRTMLPLRFVAESLGYTVSWNNATRTAIFNNGENILVINIDSRDFYINGTKYNFVVTPEIKDGRTMLPISEIGRALGLTSGNKGEGKNIEWNASTREVSIKVN